MAHPEERHASLAVLIDADNASASTIEGLLAEVAKLDSTDINVVKTYF